VILFYTFLLNDDPKTYEEVMLSIDAPFWEQAINDEMDSIMVDKTWVLTNLPLGFKSRGCECIFRKKLRTDGSIEKFKARLVAQGYKQEKEVDFFDSYLSVSKIATNRMLIAIASIYKLQIHQMDVKNVFLNGELKEEIYMKQPGRFVVPDQENKLLTL